jgi:hypothetical protein
MAAAAAHKYRIGLIRHRQRRYARQNRDIATGKMLAIFSSSCRAAGLRSMAVTAARETAAPPQSTRSGPRADINQVAGAVQRKLCERQRVPPLWSSAPFRRAKTVHLSSRITTAFIS